MLVTVPGTGDTPRNKRNKISTLGGLHSSKEGKRKIKTTDKCFGDNKVIKMNRGH